MKRWQIIALFVASLGLSATASHADEFLEAQKEIVKTLDNLRITIDSLREKIDGFQNELDGFRVQYDLKTSIKKTKKKNKKKKKKKEVKKNQKSKIYKYSWDAVVCDRFDVSTTVTADISKLRLSIYFKRSGFGISNKKLTALSGDKFTFKFEGRLSNGQPTEITGNLTPDGGKAEVWLVEQNCGGEGKLVRIKK